MAKKSAKKKVVKKKITVKRAVKKTVLKSASKKAPTKKAPAKKKARKKAIKAIVPNFVEALDFQSTGLCSMDYMGNTYCEDGITETACNQKTETYPGAIVTWTRGGQCPRNALAIDSLAE